MATTAQAGAAGASGNKRHFALAAVALVGIAAAVAAIFGTHGSAWGNKAAGGDTAASSQQPQVSALSDSGVEIKSVLDVLSEGSAPSVPEPLPAAAAVAAADNKEEAAGESFAFSNLDDKALVNGANGRTNNNGMGLVGQISSGNKVLGFSPAEYLQPSGDRCHAANYDELKDAVENQSCAVVLLTGASVYDIEEEILVSRRVTVMGNPSVMPTLDGTEAVRTFRVRPGGYLDLRFCQIVMSEGIVRAPRAWEFSTRPEVHETRGGSALFEPGAIGGIFTSVIFIDDLDQAEAVEQAIRDTLEGAVIRIYGGHVFAAGGDLEFHGCLFWDVTPLWPITNIVIIGGDVLQLGGTMLFNSCTWLETNGISFENQAGGMVAQFAGVSNFVFCTIHESNMAVANHGMGTFFVIVGGVNTITLSNLNEWSGVLSLAGLGGVAVLGGVHVQTGLSNVEAFPIGAVYGIGFEYAIGSGAVVSTGSSMNEFNCLYFYAALGEIMFIGSGLFIGTGSVWIEYVSIISENMQGATVYIGAGYGSFVGCPFSEWVSIAFVAGAGEYVAVDAGFLVWVGSPITEAACIEFARILGSVLYIGAGAMVLIRTPLYEAYGPLVTRTSEFWVMGTCEYEGGKISGSSGGEGGEGRRLLTEGERIRRELYTLPRWVAPLQGCQKDVDFFFGNAKQIEGGAGGVESEGGRRSLASAKAIIRAAQAKRGLALATKKAAPTVDRKLVSFHKKGGFMAHLPEGLRKAATNHWHGGHYEKRRMLKRAAQGLSAAKRELGLRQSTMQPEVGMLAMGVDRKQFDRKKAEKHMPAAWIDGFTSTIAELNTILGTEEIAAKNLADADRPAFHIESKIGGYCGLCNVPGVVGNGTNSCEMSDQCNGLNLPTSAKKFAAAADAVDEEEEDVHFDDHHILVLDLEATSTEALDRLDAAEIQEAVVAAVAELQGADPDREAVLVNVYQNGPDPYFAEMFPAPKRSLQETDTFTRTHHLQVALVMATKDTLALIRESLAPTADGAENKLASSIKAALFAEGTELGHIGLSEHKYLYIPAYDSLEHTQNRKRSLAAHAITLVDPSQPAVPLSQVSHNKPYKLHLENFPAGRTLKVDLVKFHDEADRAANRYLLHSVHDSVTTDKDGHAEVDVTFPAHVLAGSHYYFTVDAVDSQGGHAHGYSPAYIVTAQPAARKLYGPSLMI